MAHFVEIMHVMFNHVTPEAVSLSLSLSLSASPLYLLSLSLQTLYQGWSHDKVQDSLTHHLDSREVRCLEHQELP